VRILEIVLLGMAVVAGAAVAFRVRPSKRGARICGLIALVAFVVHLIAEGMRWQMVPAYVLLAVLVLVLLWRSRRQPSDIKRGWIRRVAGGVVRFGVLPVALVLAWFLPAAVPVFDLPEPSGPMGIGVSDLHLVFEDRPEILTADPGDVRELMVRVWYPADVADGSEPIRYFTRAEARMMADAMSAQAPVPSFAFNHVTLVSTHSYRDAAVAAAPKRFPVLAFSHGYGSFASQNTVQMEELASHGYVVFSIGHTYDGPVMFPDGRTPGLGEHITKWTKQQMEEMKSAEDREAFLEKFTRYIRETDPAKRRALFEEQLEGARRTKDEGLGVGLSWDVWIEDRTRFFDVLADLDSGARPSRFEGRLDLGRVGLFGMSFGGATAAEVCHVHPMCRASINLDGGHMFGLGSTLLDGHTSKPLMMLYASQITTYDTPDDANPGDFQAHNDFYYEPIESHGLRNDVIRIRVDGTKHMDLTDMSLMYRFIPGMASETPGPRIEEILNAYCLAFFDEYVKGTTPGSPLLDRPSPDFPEVTLQTFGHRFDERRPPAPPAE